MRSVDDRLVQDIEADRLPPVTWVTPRFELSDHPPYSTAFSHNWITDIVNAVMKSPMWEHTAIFITWDEWGGFYDHVMPPVLDDFGLGFRVPLLTISPVRAPRRDRRASSASSRRRSGSSADNWGLDPLTERIRNTHNMEHLFDFSKPPRPPTPSTVRAKTYGEPFGYIPEDYPAWPPGTTPDDYIPIV